VHNASSIIPILVIETTAKSNADYHPVAVLLSVSDMWTEELKEGTQSWYQGGAEYWQVDNYKTVPQKVRFS